MNNQISIINEVVIYEVKVYDKSGKSIKYFEYQGGINTGTFDLSYLPSGSYFIQVKTNNSTSTKQEIILK